MSTPSPAWLCLQYTLTETHVGGSGTVGATDLPIARESHTGFPFLPDTALKGVARDTAERVFGGKDAPTLRHLFGWIANERSEAGAKDGAASKPEKSKADPSKEPGVGNLAFTQGHLLLYPLRSLERPFVYATCALQLARLARLLPAFGLEVPNAAAWASLRQDAPKARVAERSGLDQHLVVESLAYGGKDLSAVPAVNGLAMALSLLFEAAPPGAAEVRGSLENDLVVLPDADFAALVRASAPIRARVALNDRKTTTGDGGNLWYEEMLPSDCLFWSVLQLRPGSAAEAGRDVSDLLKGLRHTQIGAGESTGHGRCWWWPAAGGR